MGRRLPGRRIAVLLTWLVLLLTTLACFHYGCSWIDYCFNCFVG